MDDISEIGYLIFILLIVLFNWITSRIKKAQKKKASQPSRQEHEAYAEPEPTETKRTFENILEDILQPKKETPPPIPEPTPEAQAPQPVNEYEEYMKRMEKESKSRKSNIKHVSVPEEPIEEEDNIDFDLRAGIIYSEILRRPKHMEY